jgi:pimeloyl-ACP methyl ester carboxylesterase
MRAIIAMRLLTATFTNSHRGGDGPPLVCLHGFIDTWRTWELVLPALERHHDVLAPMLPGHAGGTSIEGAATPSTLVEGVERAMDEAGFETAHVVGNSLGGHVALQLAQRGRARSVVALAPAGGWAVGDESFREALAYFTRMQQLLVGIAPHAESIVSTPEGRRRATLFITNNYEHIPADLLAHQIVGAATAPGMTQLLELGEREGWQLDASRIDCPVRVVWGTADRILPWPAAAARYRDDWLPHADWIELDGIGHCPQLDVPLETAELILGFTAQVPWAHDS